MNVLIIEDEQPAAKQLAGMVGRFRPDWRIVDVIDSVEASVQWLRTFAHPDLLFMDIQLADGVSFDIFRQVKVEAPVIFTTAYDKYTLKAFKVNSIDYLLKPIDKQELAAALDKYDSWQGKTPDFAQLLRQLTPPAYKERLLVKTGQQLTYLLTESLAYLYSEDGLTFATDTHGKRWVLENSLDEAEGFLNPKYFFRTNRKMILHLQSIRRISVHFNSRLKLELLPLPAFEVIVSRERVNDFKKWLDA